MSMIGPRTRNASCAPGEKDVNDAAMNASASEQSESTYATAISESAASTGVPPSFAITDCGKVVCTNADSAAPRTMNLPMKRKSETRWLENRSEERRVGKEDRSGW